MDGYGQDFLDSLIKSHLFLLRKNRTFWKLKAKLKSLGVDVDKEILLNRLRNLKRKV